MRILHTGYFLSQNYRESPQLPPWRVQIPKYCLGPETVESDEEERERILGKLKQLLADFKYSQRGKPEEQLRMLWANILNTVIFREGNCRGPIDTTVEYSWQRFKKTYPNWNMDYGAYINLAENESNASLEFPLLVVEVSGFEYDIKNPGDGEETEKPNAAINKDTTIRPIEETPTVFHKDFYNVCQQMALALYTNYHRVKNVLTIDEIKKLKVFGAFISGRQIEFLAMEIDNNDLDALPDRPLFVLYSYDKRLRIFLDETTSSTMKILSTKTWSDSPNWDFLEIVEGNPQGIEGVTSGIRDINVIDPTDSSDEDDESNRIALGQFEPRVQNMDTFLISLGILYRFGRSLNEYAIQFRDILRKYDVSFTDLQLPDYDDAELQTPRQSKKSHNSNTSPSKRGKSRNVNHTNSPTPTGKSSSSNTTVRKRPGKCERKILETLQFMDVVGARISLPDTLDDEGYMDLKMETLDHLHICRSGNPGYIIESGFRLIFDGLINLCILRKNMIIHGDIHPSNIMFSRTKNRYVFIDY